MALLKIYRIYRQINRKGLMTMQKKKEIVAKINKIFRT